MTPEMAFECLLVSHDPTVFSTLDRILRNFSICTNVCPTTSRAAGLLEEGSTDLIVIDWEGESSLKLLHEVWKSRVKQKPTIVAVSADDRAIPGVHVVLRKPITPESGTRSVRAAYSRMLQDYRRHARYAVMTPVQATGENNRTIPATVTNIGDGGLGLTTKEKLTIGEVLSLHLQLPAAKKEIYIQARVLWTRDYGAAGCEFLRIPPVDLQIMHDWLKDKCRVKKPLIELEPPN
ncbi:MAG: hypothetical protein LAO24_21890 [Acidobacteriia bacterium]|nr:hypothetical protein [Terriglobia bacterium]